MTQRLRKKVEPFAAYLRVGGAEVEFVARGERHPVFGESEIVGTLAQIGSSGDGAYRLHLKGTEWKKYCYYCCQQIRSGRSVGSSRFRFAGKLGLLQLGKTI